MLALKSEDAVFWQVMLSNGPLDNIRQNKVLSRKVNNDGPEFRELYLLRWILKTAVMRTFTAIPSQKNLICELIKQNGDAA